MTLLNQLRHGKKTSKHFGEKLFRILAACAKTLPGYSLARDAVFRIYNYQSSVMTFLFRQPGYLYWRTYSNYLCFRESSVPLRQSNAFKMLHDIKRLHEYIGVLLLLRSGTLLGACRQQGFAGRPGDLDFWVLLPPNMTVNEYTKKINKFSGQFCLRAGPHYHGDGGTIDWEGDEIAIVRIHGAVYADILILEKLIHDGQGYYSEYLMDGRRGRLPLILSDNIENPARLSIHGLEFCSPANWEELLAEEYGTEWRKPISKQYT